MSSLCPVCLWKMGSNVGPDAFMLPTERLCFGISNPPLSLIIEALRTENGEVDVYPLWQL